MIKFYHWTIEENNPLNHSKSLLQFFCSIKKIKKPVVLQLEAYKIRHLAKSYIFIFLKKLYKSI